ATATAEEAAPASDPAAAAADTSPAAKPAAPPAAAPAEAGAGGEAAGQAQGGASVRVQAHRLDDLMDQLGELVIAQARLRRVAGDLGDISLDTAAEEIERLVTSLRDTTLSIRMLPISLAFGRFRRLLRDLSRDLGKDVALRTLGGETEVDKNVFDSLGEPLIHMVRNAVDHGIEPAADRIAAGKTAQATVTLAARQAGGEVLISVSDDGRGLDPAAIRARAVERGMIDAEAALDESEIHQLIFAPGFSTAVTVTSVSGRGVGMDAVRRMVDELRGTIEVRSELGQGTEVTLRLPLTLAIIEGLLVRVAGSCCVLPLSSVEECVELPASEDERGAGRALLRIRDELVPYLELDEVFGFGREATANRRRVVIVRVEGRRTGLVIDEVLGQHQTVIKPLSPYHRKIEGLAGCTILGDGAVALILDPAAIVKAAQQARRLVA
ncbi:MAG: chemotaxis protein CheA, partial [Pseudomonadota bacterium]